MAASRPNMDQNRGMNDFEGVRVVVLTHGTGGEYGPLLASLFAEGLTPDRVVVVHNPSEPGEHAPVVPDGCRVLSASHNLGYTGGMNLGLKYQLDYEGDLLLVLTHDARLRPGALRTLVDTARHRPEYGVLGPALVLAGTESPFSFGGITRPNGTMVHVKDQPTAIDGIAPCDWVDGGTMLIRVELLRQIGGFDERFWIYCEDADFCLRATRAGFHIGVLPDVQAEQSPGGGRRPGVWAYLMARNGAAYAYRARGVRGLAFAGHSMSLALRNIARAAARSLRLRKGPAAEPWMRAMGAIRGTLDVLRGRWGPPPRLSGGGDVKNVGS